ncbi:MAG: hypothetical protein JW703_04385 [Candidatus Diapherotrites archaeon]|nr:hypothetical protein [Candidatus Diapherotrites archaeon]
MKKVLLMLSLMIFFSAISFADSLPPDSHSVNRCVKIDNLNDFPDYAFIYYFTGPMIRDEAGNPWNESGLIESNTCLSKGYKFNSFKVFAVKKIYLEGINLEEIDEALDSNFIESTTEIEPYGGTVQDSNPLIKEEITYSIGAINPSFLLFVTKRVNEFSDGSSETNTYEIPGIDPVYPEPKPCTDIAKICADGSIAERNPVTCEFDPCPEEKPKECTDIAKICADGSVAKRNPITCEFYPCPEEQPKACTNDVKICADGTVVARNPNNNCEFYNCPILEPVKQKNFFEAIMCFFTSLFGGKC